MTELQANQCSFCKEIWNAANLKILPFKYLIYLCPDCYNEFFKEYISVNKAPTQHRPGGYEGRKALL